MTDRRLARALVLVLLAATAVACAVPPKHTGRQPEGPRRNLDSTPPPTE